MLEVIVIIIIVMVVIKIISPQSCNEIPVLIVKRNANDEYSLENIGVGPAFNIIVLNRKSNNQIIKKWENPIKIECLKQGEVLKLEIKDQIEEKNFGVMFRDSKGRELYTKWVNGQIENGNGRLVNPYYLK